MPFLYEWTNLKKIQTDPSEARSFLLGDNEIIIMFLFAFSTSWAPPATATSKVGLTLLSDAPLARCMDGSPGGYYFAPNASSSSWIIELQGGGECASKETCFYKQVWGDAARG